MDIFPAVVTGGPESAKKRLPHTGMRDQCNYPGAEPELWDIIVFPLENVQSYSRAIIPPSIHMLHSVLLCVVRACSAWKSFLKQTNTFHMTS